LPLWEWRYLQDHECDELLKLWFAAAYARGHLFAVPNFYSWSGIPYRAKADDWAPLIQFVKDNRELLDDYVHVASVGVIYSPNDLSDITGIRDKPLAEIMDISATLAYRHLDFDFAIATNDLFPAPDWPECALMIVPETAKLSPLDKEKLGPYEESGRVIRWPKDRMALEPLKTVEAPDGVWVKPRVQRLDPTRRVYHLLNGRFDYAGNQVVHMVAFPLRFTVPEGWSRVQAAYYAPGSQPVPLAVALARGKAEVTIPSLGIGASFTFAPPTTCSTESSDFGCTSPRPR
jgi:hypothetical protein